MNTGQNYVGRGAYASSTEQTAKNADQIASTADSCNEVLNKLSLTVNSFFSSKESQKTVYALTTVLEHWIQTEYKQHVREAMCDEDIKQWDTVLANVFDTVKLITDLEKHVSDAYQHGRENTV